MPRSFHSGRTAASSETVPKAREWPTYTSNASTLGIPRSEYAQGLFDRDTAPPLESHISDAKFFADSNFYLSDPNVRGDDLDPLNDGNYYGVHVAKKFIMVVRPASGTERDTYERVGCVSMSGFGAETSDKSEFFDGTEPNLIKLV